MKKVMILSILASFTLITAINCTSDPGGPTGTLPVVQNLVVLEDSCRGDSVVLSWDAVDVEDLDGYDIWFARTDPGDWNPDLNTPDTTVMHVVSSTGYYQVMARKGLDTSSGYSNQVNTIAERIYSTYELRTDGNTGLVFGEEGATTGDASSAEFAQHIYVAEKNNLLYVFSGTHDPENYPGGLSTLLAPRSGGSNVAPHPDSEDWIDSVQVSEWGHVFVMLDTDYYVEFRVADTLYTNGFDIDIYEYQTIQSLRLFNYLF